jgi:hypothetical protein
MSANAGPNKAPSRRTARIVLVVALALLVPGLALRMALQPQRATRFLLDRVGASLGLEITASCRAGYRLRGTPQLVLRDVVAREPGSTTPLLRAGRIFVSLPWSTIRARGELLAATRLELDAPVLDLPALQHWLASRPPSTRRLPTLSAGLRISDGSIHNNDWRIDRIDTELPLLAADKPLHARLRGRYLDPPLAIPVDLAVAIVRPGALVQAQATGFATAGNIVVERGSDWRLPATVKLSGPLTLGKDDLRITPARLGVAATYESGDTHLPFALGVHGPLLFDEAVWTLSPAGVALRGRGAEASDPMPDLDARGSLALGRRLVLRLRGMLVDWPRAWPALPAPIGQSRSPLPFALDYTGRPDLSGIAALQLQRDDTRFDGRFRLQDVTGWIAADNGAVSPLPPLDGKASAPRIEIAGARLDGVEITIEDPDVPDAGAVTR